MSKKTWIGIILVILVIVAGAVAFLKKENRRVAEVPNPAPTEKKETETLTKNDKLSIVTSLEDKIGDNTAWCGTFNLIWNDLKNDLAKQDIVFSPQPEVVENLNKGTFTTSDLSEESYYKVYDTPSLALKEQIEKAIQEKFNEKSDILDDFDWTNGSSEDYFLYCMLKKEFEFPQVFTELENGQFGNYENVKYFGIDETSEENVRDQVVILYYHSKEDFAIKLLTKNNDEVIISRGNNEDNFSQMYENIMKKSEEYDGSYEFGENDTLKIPNIKFDLKEEIKEVEKQPFYFSNGKEYTIDTALQTIQFELDKKGGKIKSEAGMTARATSILMPEEPREFLVDNTFSIFLIEQERKLPYFAAKIADITTVQKDAKIGNSQKTEPKENSYFYGKVVESDKNHILVKPNEGEEVQASADKISISLEENSDYIYEVGANVKITYNGTILETYPAQVEAINIELKSAENFEIHFVDQSYESKQKVRTILNKDESEKYDYNVYSYNGEVNIVIDGEEMSLRDALLKNKITMDEVIAKANQDVEDKKIDNDMYNDGGSIEYHYEDYTMIKVHNLDGNRDVYIGTAGMHINNLGL